MILKRTLAALIVCLALPYAWAPLYRFPKAQPFSGAHLFNPYAALHGTWKRANLHAHGRAWFGVTNGRQSDMEVLQAYKARGYDVAGISDYHYIAAFHGVPTMALYEHGFNVGKHHQLAIGATAVAWFDFPLWQGLHQKQYVINRVKASAALVAINHPSALGGYSYSDDDLRQLTGYQLLEVVNGRFEADELWDAALSAGRVVWAIGDDDTHDITNPDRMAVAWNMIDAPTTHASDIVDALRTGRSYVAARAEGAGRGDVVVTGVTVRDGRITVECAGAPSAIEFIGQNGTMRSQTPNVSKASYALTPDDTYIRTIIRTPQTVLYLNPIIRYDGVDLPSAIATEDVPKTWLLRFAIVAACAGIVWRLGRRSSRRGGNAGDRMSLRRASLFMMVFAISLAAAGRASAQTAAQDRPGVGEGPPLGSSLTFDLLRDLPTSDNLFSVLETTQAEIISDRFSGGGLNFGTSARIGAFGSSWTQTMFRVGDVNVTDPSRGGTPMMFPEVGFWQKVSVVSGAMPPDLSAPGVAVTLEPLRPAAVWTTSVEGSSSFRDALTATAPVSGPPSLSRLHDWNRGSLLVSGPLIPNRLGLVFAGAYTAAAQTDRSDLSALDAKVASGFANVVFSPAPGAELRTVGWVQRTETPPTNRIMYTDSLAAERDTSAHVQSTWQQSAPLPFRLFGSYTNRSRTPLSSVAPVVTIDRLTDGPPQELVGTGAATDRRWSIGARLGQDTPPSGRQTAFLGIDVSGARATADPPFSGTIREAVDQMPARLWLYAPGGASVRHATTFAAFAADRLVLAPGLLLEVATRYEAVRGSADGAAQDLSWSNVLPRASLRMTVMPRFGMTLFGAYARTAYQLALDDLAWGDPAAASATVFRWPGTPAATTRLWQAGPGSVGRIDPNLRRPYSDDLVIGVDAQPTHALRVQLAGVAKWEKQLLGVVNQGNPAPAYTTMFIDDPGLDLANAGDDQRLPAANFIPSPQAPYRFDYVLTNPSGAAARLLAAKFTAELQARRLFLMLGATAFMAEGNAAYQGFGVNENDQGLVGDAYTNPNAGLFPYGRLFNDRAFTIKLTSVYRFPAGVTLGAIARYQDGQPFSRLVLATGLTQGPEAIRAFPNGGSRFTFTGTLDVRLQKEFVVAGTKLALVADAYNLVNLGNEVEERVVSGPDFRTVTAIQPPLTARFGLRFTF